MRGRQADRLNSIKPAALPKPLLHKLMKLRPILERRGSLLPHSRPGKAIVWRIRYQTHDPDGGSHHRNVSVGNEATAKAARMLISSWREEWNRQQRAVRAVADAKTARERQHSKAIKGIRRAVVSMRRGGRYQRLRIGRTFDKARKTAFGLYAFALMAPWEAVCETRGRPTKSSLW